MNDIAPSRRAGLLGVVCFTAAYMLAAVVAAIITGNGEFIFYIVIMLVMIAAVLAVHVRVGLTNGLLWALSIWGLSHMAGGLVPVPESWPINGDIRVLYSWWVIPFGDNTGIKYDHFVHCYGYAVTTWLCWQGLRSVIGKVKPTLGLMVLVAAAGNGFGALNEIVEFVATLMLPETNVGGYINTGWDLVANFTGTIIAAVVIYVWGRGGE